MPNIDQAAKAWELEFSGRVGAAVQSRRKALKLTALQLAERTKKLGYPITRVAISKIETNSRAGKLDIAELFVLAEALEIPVALLLFLGFPEGSVQLLPGYETNGPDAVDWLAGAKPLPAQILGDGNYGDRHPPNDGITIINQIKFRETIERELHQHELLLTLQQDQRTEQQRKRSEARVRELTADLAATDREINQLRLRLWGISGSVNDA